MMRASKPTLSRRIMSGVSAVGIAVLTLWGTGAIWFQLSGLPLVAFLTAWLILGLSALLATIAGARLPLLRHAPLMFFIAALELFAWWYTLRPSHQRAWADDVSELLQVRIDHQQVVLRNVRNFEWRSETDYTPRWETRTYDLDRLETADLALSYWMGPHVAHTLISFGFSDGRHVTFSLEIRKERGEAFSAIGGLFRQYEQVLVAADERDIIRTRSNARGEDVYLYSLNLTPEEVRALFLGYVKRANELHDEPRFYNTISSNCTTIVDELARSISPGLPMDYRLLLSGHLAEYVHDLGGLAENYEYEKLHRLGYINRRARASDSAGDDFSTAIRREVPSASRSQQHQRRKK